MSVWLSNIFKNKSEIQHRSPAQPRLDDFHVRIVVGQRSDARPHTCLFDSLKGRTKDPCPSYDYPNVNILGEMMFGTMPIKSQPYGLKVYRIDREAYTKIIFIRLFGVDFEAHLPKCMSTVKLTLKTQFALATVFTIDCKSHLGNLRPSPGRSRKSHHSVGVPVQGNAPRKASKSCSSPSTMRAPSPNANVSTSKNSSAAHLDIVEVVDGSGESNEVRLLLSHSAFIESQLEKLATACRGALEQAISIHSRSPMYQQPSTPCSPKSQAELRNDMRQLEPLLRIKLPRDILQNDLAIRSAARVCAQGLSVFFNPSLNIVPFWSVVDGVQTENPSGMKETFFTTLVNLLDTLESAHSSNFLSSVVTAVLMHHLTWATASFPNDSKDDFLDSDHVNSEMINSLYGRNPDSEKTVKFIILGNPCPLVDKLLHFLTYFIRCGSVLERVDELAQENFLQDPSLNITTPANGHCNGTDPHDKASKEEENCKEVEDTTCGLLNPGNGVGGIPHAMSADDGQYVPLPSHSTLAVRHLSITRHCYSAATKALSVPFLIVKVIGRAKANGDEKDEASTPMHRNSCIELTDEDLIYLCRDSGVKSHKLDTDSPSITSSADSPGHPTNSSSQATSLGEKTSTSPSSMSTCVVINTFARLCYVAHVRVEHNEPEGASCIPMVGSYGHGSFEDINSLESYSNSPSEWQRKMSMRHTMTPSPFSSSSWADVGFNVPMPAPTYTMTRNVISSSEYIQHVLHQLGRWKRNLDMNDTHLFQWLDSRLYEIYQQSLVLAAICQRTNQDQLSFPLMANCLDIDVSHIALVKAVAACHTPCVKDLLPDPPLVDFHPSFRLESLVDSLF